MIITSSVVVKENRRILLMRRTGGSWPDHWCLPGGKVEAGESFEQAAIRELWEEVGITVAKEPLILLGCTHTAVDGLGVVFLLNTKLRQAVNKEPAKCSEIRGFIQSRPPIKLIPSLAQFIKRYPNLWRADRDLYENLRASQSNRKATCFKKYGLFLEHP